MRSEIGREMKLYVAGPMRGYPNFNFPLFDEATEHYRSLGFYVVSPAEHDREICDGNIEDKPGYATGDVSMYAESTGFDFKSVIMWDLAQIAECDGIVLLPGHENSSGARVELALAQALGLEVMEYAVLNV